MRSTLNIPDELVEQVQKESGSKTKTEAITTAMQEYLRLQKRKKLIALLDKKSFAFDWEKQEEEELKAEKKRQQILGK
ncbi:MAG: type II toxin-antitoxin system VapB family antitoxin [Dissulfurispiraceae bacterium]